MPRCEHDWQPLIQAKAPTEEGARLRFAFSLELMRLAHYDRCTKCGRLSHITKFARRRSLVSNEWTHQRLLERAAQFEEWAKKNESGEI